MPRLRDLATTMPRLRDLATAMPRLRDLAELVRAPAALSVPGDAVAGAAAARVLGPGTVGLAAASVCLYWAGMAANDWADRELDATERPERPIPSGRVSPQTALCTAVGLTGLGLTLAAAAGGRRALAVAVPLAGAVWTYDLAWKNTRHGPAGMAVCRGLDVLLGASPGHVASALRPAAVVAAHTYALTALSRKEVSGTTRGLPTATLAATAVLAAAASVPSRAGTSAGRRFGVAATIAAWYAAAFGVAQRRVLRAPTAPHVRAAVGAGITALPALQGALTAAAGAPGPGLAVALAAPVGRRLARRMSPT
jgi:4-hydroxybenzoate polyprenyltransferase